LWEKNQKLKVIKEKAKKIHCLTHGKKGHKGEKGGRRKKTNKVFLVWAAGVLWGWLP